ncbi:MAG: hypothetical protein ACRDO2_09610 [Nocardioidaceae bacterium]
MAKTGTTFLQRVLFQNQALLGSRGVLYPGGRRASHFHASMDLRDVGFKGHRYPEAEGAWQRLAGAVNGHRGSAVVSHETLARCNPEQIQRAVTSFEEAEVRVIVTARDLGRQIPAVWQERIKNRSGQAYEDFLDEVLSSKRGKDKRGDFWLPQWLPGLLERWSAAVGPEQVTVVTVPPSGGDPHELWRRFAAAAALPDAPYNLQTQGANTSLGIVGAELLRRMNADFVDLPWPRYESMVKRQFAEFTLGRADDGPRITIPPDRQDEVAEISERSIEEIQKLGVNVIGDLEDLRPRLDRSLSLGPVSSEAMLALASHVLAESVIATDGPVGSASRSRLSKIRARLAVGERLRRTIGRVRRG